MRRAPVGRARRLTGDGGQAAERALEALIRGRLVLAGEGYEIAHEALARGWPRLRAWLDEASDERAAARRLAEAAAEWERIGRAPETLWNARQIAELSVLEGRPLPAEVAAFVAESRAAVRRAWVRRWAIRAGAPLAVLLLLAGIVGVVRWREQRQTRAFVAARIAEADGASREALAIEAQVETARAAAFARFDGDDRPGGEARWKEALDLARRASDAFDRASAPLGQALARDPLDPVTRARAADLTHRRLLAAERDHDADLARDLGARLAQLDDDGSRRARLAAPAHLRVTTDPPGRSSSSTPSTSTRTFVAWRTKATQSRSAPRWSWRPARTSSPRARRAATRRVSRCSWAAAARWRWRSRCPPPRTCRPGWSSSRPASRSSARRTSRGPGRGYSAEPEHPVHVDAFLIGTYEVTYAEYLAFLAALPAAERALRRPHGADIDLGYDREGVPVLTLRKVTARRGELFCRPKRSERRCQDWLRFPVAGVSGDDAQAYVEWLARGRLPGARRCTEREWERAARGADGRLFVHGDDLRPGDADFDEKLHCHPLYSHSHYLQSDLSNAIPGPATKR